MNASTTSAAPIVYTLTGTTNPVFGSTHSESFRFTASGFVNSWTTLSAGDLDACVACISSGPAIDFVPNGALDVVIPVDLIRFTDANGIVYGFFFVPEAFSNPGTYTAFGYFPYITSNLGVLTVEETPEPSTLLLMMMGLSVLIAAGNSRLTASLIRSGHERL
ncbi:PEP-CTERM sorting domain-containing protein [Paludibaculum fermentans]|uniref:PEP-CTERM sorting domain-containing protein n=1 Tax=Paludibaculum fermentans TaxID=1473598 RepID=UPI003EBE5750